MDTEPELVDGPHHLNNTGCLIKISKDKGRGVYASRFIPRNTLLEISPVLLFEKEEYESHGRYTVLDHYTFIWSEGRMALALGLGSLFNHAQTPNISYTLDTKLDCIKYTSVRDIEPGEELCIFYGHNLWFSTAQPTPEKAIDEADDGWGGLTAVVEDDIPEIRNPYADGPQDEIIPEEELPFVRYKLPPEEEDAESIRTVQAWIVDVPDARHITTLLKWLKQTGLDGPELGHLKRIRKHSGTTSLLLCADPDAPNLPAELALPAPYQLPVPASSALTAPSLALKAALWPTLFTPRRKDEPEPWTRGQLRWAWDALQCAVTAAARAKAEDELPIAAVIAAPYSQEGEPGADASSRTFMASDTRRATAHPLRHAAINAVRKLADSQGRTEDAQASDAAAASSTGALAHEATHTSALPSTGPSHSPSSATAIATARPETPMPEPTSPEGGAAAVRNGSNYLLTERTVFLTHEPCIMCSMALLHSRVRQVVYLHPMALTGGCGGCACLPALKGVNHRFAILRWRGAVAGSDELALDDSVDA